MFLIKTSFINCNNDYENNLEKLQKAVIDYKNIFPNVYMPNINGTLIAYLTGKCYIMQEKYLECKKVQQLKNRIEKLEELINSRYIRLDIS